MDLYAWILRVARFVSCCNRKLCAPVPHRLGGKEGQLFALDLACSCWLWLALAGSGLLWLALASAGCLWLDLAGAWLALVSSPKALGKTFPDQLILIIFYEILISLQF